MITDSFTGFYTYKDIKTINKFKIMIVANNLSHVRWNYHDDFFSQFDWTKEPTESLDELYAERARQIRDTYDYVILMYSGGSDSQNVLDSFVDNNIFLDEICSTINYSTTSTIDNAVNYEVLGPNGAKEKAESVKHPNTIYRLYDISDMTIQRWSNIQDSHHWSNNTRPRAGRIMDTNVDKWKQLYKTGKKICFIWGNYKPCVTEDSGNYYFQFTDYLNTQLPYRSALMRDEATDEQFYWYPSIQSANLIIKQSHVIKNFISNPITQLYLANKYNNIENSHTLELYDVNNSFRFGSDDMKRLIYPKWNESNYIHVPNNKHVSFFLSDQEKWFWNSNTDQSKRYLKFIEDYNIMIRPFWSSKKSKFNNKEYIAQLRTVQSIRYKL